MNAIDLHSPAFALKIKIPANEDMKRDNRDDDNDDENDDDNDEDNDDDNDDDKDDDKDADDDGDDDNDEKIIAFVDVAAVIYAILPFEGYSKWPTPAAINWLSEEKIAKIIETGINLVAKADLCWQVSFAQCETVLVSEIDEETSPGSGKGCRRAVYRITKRLLEQACLENCYNRRECQFATYLLKVIF